MKLTIVTTAARFLGPLLVLACPALVAFAAGAPGMVEGRLTQVTTNHVQVDHDRTYQFNPAVAECFDFRGDAMACHTLVAIGYVDRARVTLRGTNVQRIEIVELHQ
jgi:hypothetical protein